MNGITALILAFTFTVGVRSACGAQERALRFDDLAAAPLPDPEPTERTTFGRLVVPATLGSLAGTAIGGLWGGRLEWGNSDYRGLEGVLLFGMLGGTIGSATGAWLADRGRGDVGYGPAVFAAAVGVVGGVFGAYTVSAVSRGDLTFRGVYIGFALGQGIVTAAAALGQSR